MRKGEITRAAIMESAKKEFYERGYIAVRIRDITEKMNLQTSWVSYYFKTKDNLVAEISREASLKVEERMKQSGLELQNPMLFHFVRARLLFGISMEDDNTKRFRYEITYKNATLQTSGFYNSQIYGDIVRYYGLDISEARFYVLRDMCTVARNHFLVNYLDGRYKYPIDHDQAFTILEGIFPHSIGLDPNLVEDLLAQSIDIAKKIDVQGIHLLLS